MTERCLASGGVRLRRQDAVKRVGGGGQVEWSERGVGCGREVGGGRVVGS